MGNSVERSLFLVFVAGVLATLYLFNDSGSSPQPEGDLPPEPTVQSADSPTTSDLEIVEITDPITDDQPEALEETPPGHQDTHDHNHDHHDHDHENIPTTTLIYPPTGRIEQIDPSPPPEEDGQPGKCAPIQELWGGDSYPVEDPCTLAEVRRALYLAYTGTDEQRRSVIRNGHLLDEVFAALDDYGRTHDAAFFDPERRGQAEVIFEGISWRGGPEAEQGVIAVLFRLNHPEIEPTDSLLDTLVQVDGRWKLSYRRSYCVKVVVIMEFMGNNVRCPVDPNPEINEDEATDSTGRYR